MKRKKILNGLIIFGILSFLFLAVSPTANAQFPYFGPFGPYFAPPLTTYGYGYGIIPFLPPAPVPFLGAYRGANVVTPTLPPIIATAPAVTPAGLSITNLIPTPPLGTITFTIPVTPVIAPAVATLIVPTTVAPLPLAPTTVAPTFVAAPTVAAPIPGLTTAILFTGGGTPGTGGGSLLSLATLGLLPVATPTTLTTLGLLPSATPVLPVATPLATGITTAFGVATALLVGGGGGISTTSLILLGLI